MWSTIITFALSSLGIWALFKYIILIELRIDANTFKTLYDLCKDDRKIMITEEFVSETRYPVTYAAICRFKNSPLFYISHSERLMQAGWQNKDYITSVIFFRWQYRRMKHYLHNKIKEMQLDTLGVPVQLMLPYCVDKIGSIKEIVAEPVVDEALWKDFENEVSQVADGKRNKTSALLYGLPGNGKTNLVKYFATKYRLPIMILTFNPDWSNHDLLLLFSQIPNRCIVLLEDFDNYFDKRKCIIGNESKSIKFTFDIILNGLDGVYTTYENVVFIMTVNDIEKVDPALRSRPSRFKFTRHFDNPSLEVRKKILPADWAEATKSFNLDQIFRLKEYHDQGIDFYTAVKMLEKEIPQEEIHKKAYARYQERIANNIQGDAESDWQYALELFRLGR